MPRASLFALLAAFLLPLTAYAQSTPAGATPVAKGKIVFVANTGLEDLGTLSSSLRHAIAAKESAHTAEVVWLTYGRAIVALDPTVSAVPEEIRKLTTQAKALGIRLVACGNALSKFGIDPKKTVPRVEVVPNGVDELMKLVADGYAVIRY